MIEADKNYFLEFAVLLKAILNRAYSDFCRQILWKSKGTGADIGEGDCFASVIDCELKGVSVAISQQTILLIFAIFPNWTYGMNNKFSW